MNRTLILLALFIFPSIIGISQDTIYTVNDETIISKVIEVLSEEVKYKKFDNPDGPLYTMNKTDVRKIVYKNGSVDVFNESAKKSKTKNDEKNKGQMIIHIGATYSSFRGDVSSTKRILGFTGGFSTEIPIDKSFQNYIDLTFLYEQKGTAYNDQSVEINGDIYDASNMEEKHEYITIAVTYKRFFSDRQMFFGRIGLFGGYLYEAMAKGTFKSLEYGDVNNLDRSVKELYSKTDFGASIGLGINIPLQTGEYKSSFIFDARYNIGLSDIYLEPDNALYSTGNIFTSDFVAMIGFRFPF